MLPETTLNLGNRVETTPPAGRLFPSGPFSASKTLKLVDEVKEFSVKFDVITASGHQRLRDLILDFGLYASGKPFDAATCMYYTGIDPFSRQ